MDNNAKCVKRLLALFDPDTFTEIGAYTKSVGGDSEVVTGYGYINGTPVYAFSQNSEVNGGAMGKAHAAKIKKIYDLAAKTGLPVVGIYDCGGAYIEEGLDALAAYGELMLYANNISGVVPQVSVVSGKCVGCSAMMAASSDVVIITKGSQMYISPEGENSAESAIANGTAQILAEDDDEAAEYAKQIISMLPLNNLAVVPCAEIREPEYNECKCLCSNTIDAGSKLKISAGFGKSVKTVLARIMGVTCGIINYKSEDDVIDSDSCVKAARFIRMCDSFSVPVISLVDAVRFGDGAQSEVKNASLLSHAYSEATTAKISVVTGSACGAVFAAIASRGANADLVYALDSAKISVLSPKAAAMVLMSERRANGESLESLAAEYEKENCSPQKAAADGYVDDIFTANELRGKLYTALEMLSGKRVSGFDKKHSNMPL